MTNAVYRLRSHAGTGDYLNVYGNETVSKNRDVWLWSLDTYADAQKWKITGQSAGKKIMTALDESYALNYYWASGQGKAGNCDIYPHIGNDADSVVELAEMPSASGVYTIKLAHYALYLTANGTGDGAKVTWEPKSNTITQQWKFETVLPMPFAYPTQTKRLSQGYHSGHRGIDIPAVTGTPVYAFCDGVVAVVQNSSISWHPNNDTSALNGSSVQSMGNMITINHSNPCAEIAEGMYARSIYMHLQKAPSMQPLDKVKKGDLIGYVGNTGRSTGAHLHFSLAVGDRDFMMPGAIGWKPLGQLPMIDPCKYLSGYLL